MEQRSSDRSAVEASWPAKLAKSSELSVPMEDERGSRFHDENERLSRETSDDDDDGTTPAQQSASSASLTVPLPRRDRDSEPDAVSSSEPKLNSGDRSALLALNRSTSLTLPNREKKRPQKFVRR